jgi:hypothetical protein
VKKEVIEAKIKELEKNLAAEQKYRTGFLKSQADLLKQIDVSHMRVVLELKKALATREEWSQK